MYVVRTGSGAVIGMVKVVTASPIRHSLRSRITTGGTHD